MNSNESTQPQTGKTDCKDFVDCFNERVSSFAGEFTEHLKPVQKKLNELLADPTNLGAYENLGYEISVLMEKQPMLAAAIEAIPYAGSVVPLFDAIRHRKDQNYWKALGSVAESASGVVLGPAKTLIKHATKVRAIAKKAKNINDAINKLATKSLKKIDSGFKKLPGATSKKLPKAHPKSKLVFGRKVEFRKNTNIDKAYKDAKGREGRANIHRNGTQGEEFVRKMLNDVGGEFRAGVNRKVPGYKHERRPDLFDPSTGRAIEVKNYGTSKPRASSFMKSQINRDVALRKQLGDKYKPEWHFMGKPPTDGLKEYLEKKGIPYVIYP